MSEQRLEALAAAAVEQCCAFIHKGAARSQNLACWADVSVGIMIIPGSSRAKVPSWRADLSNTGI